MDQSPESTNDASTSRRRPLAIGIVLLVAVVAAFAVWFTLIRDTSAASVVSVEAAAARAQALSDATSSTTSSTIVPTTATSTPSTSGAPTSSIAETPATTAASTTVATPGPTVDPDAQPASLSGPWLVDTSIGTFDDSCLSEVCDSTFVGFRIDEELARIGSKTVVGRSPGVTGSLMIDGTAVTSVDITVDMTLLLTDDRRRTNAIRRQALETFAFPEARFVLSEPIALGDGVLAGEAVDFVAEGELTVHGVTRAESVELTAQLVGDVIVVFGQLGPITLADYEIEQPTAIVVLSVEDHATMELQLFFTR